jgi:hypothetical protein
VLIMSGEGTSAPLPVARSPPDYPHSESTFPHPRQILAEILEGVPDDEQAKPAPDPDPGIAVGNTARVYKFDVASLTDPA